ncbi:MAG: 3-hydroxyacyl-CoA dehydrogenase [Desertimonas sp.]
MAIRHVMVAGGGVMGSQVAWQTAWHGFDVTIYDAFDAGLDRCRDLLDAHGQTFIDQRSATTAEVQAARARIALTTDLAAAAGDADLVIEQVPEDMDIKRDFWRRASAAVGPDALLVTNTSSLLPSEIVDAVSGPERFLSLHFCVPVWDANIGEVMAQPSTTDEAYEAIAHFAADIGLVPVRLRKEWPGYVLNALLIPFLLAGIDLVRNDVADPAAIDQVWQICNKSEIGPCQMVDMVGMNVAYHIAKGQGEVTGDQNLLDIAAYLKSDFIDQGRLGIESGRGFYDYAS